MTLNMTLNKTLNGTLKITLRATLISLLFLAICISQSSKGNTILSFEYKNYAWQNHRELVKLTSEESLQAAMILKDMRIIEYFYDDSNELKAIETVHKIIRVNTIDAVSMFNKVFIPIDNTLTIIVLKARFISATGKITELNYQNIKDLENINNGTYKIFAIEGVEIGGEIEYYYSLEQKPRLFGRELFQTNLPTKNMEFEIITPKSIVFEAKSYNNIAAITTHEKYENKSAMSVFMAHIPAIDKLNYETNHAGRVDFKLSFYAENPTRKIFTWNSAAQFIAESVYLFQKLPANQLQTAKTVLQSIIKPSSQSKMTDEQKIIAIENYIKENIRVEEDCNHDGISAILETKYANKLGIIRLFALFFDLAAVPHQVVLTSDKTKAKFDKDFENWIFLEHYLFYFPEKQTYLAPNHLSCRYSLVPPYLTMQDGLFIDYSFQVASTVIQEIPAAIAAATVDESEFILSFDNETYQMKGTCRKHFSGYYATSLAYAYEMTENKQVLSERIFRISIADVALADTKITTYPINLNKIANKTMFLDIETSLLSTSLVEQAGDKLLFRVGDLLAQGFNEVNLDKEIIEQDFNKTFKRKIILTIPQGYVVRNLENLKYIANTDKNTAWFIAEYELQGNQIKLSIEGGSNQIYYANEQKEVLRQVIKAIKNFEQTVLVFQKIK